MFYLLGLRVYAEAHHEQIGDAATDLSHAADHRGHLESS